jgi:2-phospho-L-lactate guanylyltransferase (CobY/MobA/RfbA family)
MTTFMIPFRAEGKTRLGDSELAAAMLADVTAAVRALRAEPRLVDGPGGQGNALTRALAAHHGPVTILNSDLPCITSTEIEQLTEAAPAIVAADAGTTNAIALRDASQFTPLYGTGSAARFEAELGAARLDLPGLRDDVDTWDDLERVRERVGPNTREYLNTLVHA